MVLKSIITLRVLAILSLFVSYVYSSLPPNQRDFSPYELLRSASLGSINIAMVNPFCFVHPKTHNELRFSEADLLSMVGEEEESSNLHSFTPQEIIQREFAGEIPEKVLQAISFLTENKNALSYGRLLLHGPSGTGKTTLARLIARATGRKLVEVSASHIGTKYINSTAQGVAGIFRNAKSLRHPLILFIDEVDCIGLKRANEHEKASKAESGTDDIEHRKGVLAFCKELDGCADNFDIFIICCTNNPKQLDHAIKRRFINCTVEMHLPNLANRKAILKHWADQEHLQYDERDIDAIAQKANNFSSDELKQVINQAAYLMLKVKNSEQVSKQLTKDHLSQAYETLKNSRYEVAQPNRIDWYKRFTVTTTLISLLFGGYNIYQGRESFILQKASHLLQHQSLIIQQSMQERGLLLQHQGLTVQQRGVDLQQAAQSSVNWYQVFVSAGTQIVTSVAVNCLMVWGKRKFPDLFDSKRQSDEKKSNSSRMANATVVIEAGLVTVNNSPARSNVNSSR